MIVAAACPAIRPLAVRENLRNCLQLARQARRKKARIVLFPPECLAGVTAGDLGDNPAIRKAIDKAENDFRKATEGDGILYLFNLPRNAAIESPSGRLALISGDETAACGAALLLNPSANPERVDTRAKRLLRIRQRRGVTVHVSPSSGESTSRQVYSGATLIAKDGVILAEGPRWSYANVLIAADTDTPVTPPPFHFPLGVITDPASPFIPFEPAIRDERMGEIFAIQTTGLATRLRNSGIDSAVIGLSGGLDSTLALLVTHTAFRKLGLPLANLHCVTLPGFGTSGRTRDNATQLAELLGLHCRTISIAAACNRHFKDIGHDPENRDLVYENAQARERTQILMDIANQVGGIVVGTGDLSELALGWCTFSGDQISHYAVNADLPKTLVRQVVAWVAENNPDLEPTLTDILQTPISPELLPGQETESLVGPYELHDYFLYYFVGKRLAPAEIFAKARKDFPDYKPSEIKRYLNLFSRRLVTQHFKRSCTPDYPIIGSVSFDSSAFSLPGDADWRLFQI
ncbi:MAG: NAD(+) synthase [Kiritimatiellia bacterium]